MADQDQSVEMISFALIAEMIELHRANAAK